MGTFNYVTNESSGSVFAVSTVKKMGDVWQIAIFRKRRFLPFTFFPPFAWIVSVNDQFTSDYHDFVTAIVAGKPIDHWAAHLIDLMEQMIPLSASSWQQQVCLVAIQKAPLPSLNV
jgi:hypothetical protein